MSSEINRIGRPASTGVAARLGVLLSACGDEAAAPYLFFGLMALMLLPAAIWPIPNAADIVNHWARLTVLGMSADDPLAKLYAVKLAIIPNLGMDALYLLLSPLLSPLGVARWTWALALGLPAWGAWRLHRAWFAKPQLAILLIPAISYNLVVTVGLVNFGLGIGVALLAFAWVVGDVRRSRWTVFAVLNLVSVILFFCHVLALFAFCVAYGLYEITPRRLSEWRAALMRGLLTAPNVACGLILLFFAERTPSGFRLTGDKSMVFDAPFLASTDHDRLFRFAILLIIGAAMVTRRISVHLAARAMLVTFGAMILVMPPAWGAGNLLDARLAVFWAFLAVAAMAWEWSGRFARFAVAALVALSVARFASIVPAWSEFQREVAEMRAVIAVIPPGARTLVVKPPSEICRDPEMPMFNNLTTLIVIDRRASVNTLFADPGMQPVRFRDPSLAATPKMAMSSWWLLPETRARLGGLAESPWAGPFLNWRDHFDTIVSLHGRCDGRLDVPGLKRVGVSAVADVYRVQ
jgi:hypothetical protein